MSKKYGRIVLLQGGVSPEREISLQSADNIAPALATLCDQLLRFDPQEKCMSELPSLKPDMVFNILHGGEGEDGTIQAALETFDIPVTGSHARACLLAMDKRLSKLVWEDEGLGTPPWRLATDLEPATLDAIQLDLGDAVFVKPNNGGSSQLASRAHGRDELTAAIKLVLDADCEALVEQLIDGIEVTYGIVGEQVLPGIRIEVPHGFYDYRAKYIADDTRFICPPDLPGDLDARASALSLRAYQALGCSDWGRVDMLISGQDLHLLEINTIPGMTSHSLVPQAARQAGMELPQLLEAIMESAGS